MRFGKWYPLEEAGTQAPEEPGVFQVRVETGLIEYPKGKSAMIHYALADDLRAATTAFAEEHAGSKWLCRHTIEPAVGQDLQRLYTRLLKRFTQSFGTPPRLP